MAELSANRRIPQGLIRRLGAEIVAVVRHVNEHQIDMPKVPTAEAFQRAKAIRLWAEAWGRANLVAPGLLVPPSLANEIADDGTAALDGWRAEAIQDALQDFLNGQTKLSIDEQGACLV